MMNTYANLTNEELVSIIQSGCEAAYEQLFQNLHPVILHEAAMYIGKMETYALEDLVQECRFSVPGTVNEREYKYIENTVAHIRYGEKSYVLTGIGMRNILKSVLAFLLMNNLLSRDIVLQRVFLRTA